jgi:hypothetical protein
MEVAERDRGVRWPVCPLDWTASVEPRGWVGWRDSWCSNGDRTFGFDSACWTAFWGSPSGRKEQLLRAEWDGCPVSGTGFAQPHWHFDREQLALMQAPAVVGWAAGPTLVELEELPTQPTDAGAADEVMQQLGLSAIHLGMAGWDHDTRYPRCWQSSLDGDALLHWATRSLELIAGELSRMRTVVVR